MKMTTLRLDEESTILLAEMGSLYSSYRYLARQWAKHANDSLLTSQTGHTNYAEQRCVVWDEYAENARVTFNDLVGTGRVLYHDPNLA